MRFLKTLTLIAGLLCSFVASSTTVEMDVNGLVCAFCAQGIEKTLKKFPAAEGVFVSLERRLVAVALKQGADIDDHDLRDALTNAGYTVVAIRRSETSLDTLRNEGKPHD
ncbi:MAG: heavy-metal-associated domain-containing protein [Tahibacter sp.]